MAVFKEFSDPERLAEFAAASVAAQLAQGLAQRQTASLVVPGGRTPARFLTLLGDSALDWSKIAVTLSDERWVDDRSPDSNAALLQRSLFAGRASSATFVSLYNDAASPEEGLAPTEARLRSVARPWDSVIVGMGDDGHFASLFPHEPVLAEGLDLTGAALCVPAHGPAGGPPRLSLTLASLAATRHITILATGTHKRSIWQAAATAQPTDLPIAALARLTDPAPVFLWCP